LVGRLAATSQVGKGQLFLTHFPSSRAQ
jgi:hypothetical protein